MSLNNIVFNKAQGSLGNIGTNTDFISGIIFFSDTVSLQGKYKFASVQDAMADGFSYNANDGVSSSCTVTIGTAGNTGDSLAISSVDITGNPITLASYVVPSASTTATLQAADIVLLINKSNTGFSATNASGVITIKANVNTGVYYNTKTLTIAKTGAIVATATAFSGGVASNIAIYFYHISEYFRLNPNGLLYVGIFSTATRLTNELTQLQSFANNSIVQIAVYDDTTSGVVSNLTVALNYYQTQLLALEATKQWISALLYTFNCPTTQTMISLPDLSGLLDYKVSCVVSQDGAGKGNSLYIASGKSISNIGACLGTISLAAVSQDIGQVSAFNISDGVEDQTLAFINGTFYTNYAYSDLNVIDNLRYIFLVNYTGYAGSYWNKGNTAVSTTSDYNLIPRNRTIDKAIKLLYQALLPIIDNRLYVNADGTLTSLTVKFVQSLCNSTLTQMISSGDLSNADVIVPANQNIIQTNNLTINVRLIPTGFAQLITVNVGFVTNF